MLCRNEYRFRARAGFIDRELAGTAATAPVFGRSQRTEHIENRPISHEPKLASAIVRFRLLNRPF